ncbi:hypothetical protein [Streptomyces apocyni]|uniref:hypothetical protein n=1 Tax=Streptomyces apocyni TaxID=2654677 RepID=UPI001E49F69F|nr:hypothetical protein [Streptomyces apocyni]
MSRHHPVPSPAPPDPHPVPPARPATRPARFVGWLGGFGCAAAAYAVFQSLLSILPEGITGDSARYAIAAVSGLGTGVAAWLSAALVRALARERIPGAGAPPSPAAAAPASHPPPGPFPELASAAYETLIEKLSVVDDPSCGRLTGWPHSLGEADGQRPGQSPVRPTAVGTAYGLHLALELGVPDGRLATGELVRTLWRLRLPDGGWSARSQGEESRPEVTALVLGVLARTGADPTRVGQEAAACAARFTRELDHAGRDATHVMTSVLRCLLRAAPDAGALPALRDALVEGAVTDARREHRRCWARRLSAPHGPPTAVHTAQAVVALDRAARAPGAESPQVRAAREDGVRWLLACPAERHDTCGDLTRLREEIRRPRTDAPGHHEVLNVRHFTAAWVLRALLTQTARDLALAEGLEGAWRERLAGAAAAVWRGQTDGIWTWAGMEAAEPRRPLWMTYQGVSALRAHALYRYQPDGGAPGTPGEPAG